MRCRSETILLLESVPFVESRYGGALAALGYLQLHYHNYTDARTFQALSAEIDGVVAVWTDEGIVPERVARAVASAASLYRVRGVLVISPFATAANARLLMRNGARAWARPPVSLTELGARLDCLLRGDRRQRAQPVVIDRRQAPLYPVAAA